ncbi:type II toxin-antitoxin system VapC family toxin [Micromonospora sp. NPDC049240]|uniref:type II toxin-antitoxin system VapC family toxin n=1 Tax=Micromonospora sp. NPDC049240 TaxID=3155151 RepID=UPI0033FFD070
MSTVVLDTDVASAILRGRVDERLRARLTGRTLVITFVTLGELTKWTVVRSWGPRKLADLARWRRTLVLLPFDEAVAIRWGQLQAAAQLRGRPRPVNDSWIAACCLVHQVPLATYNGKDYADFAEHDRLRLLDLA